MRFRLCVAIAAALSCALGCANAVLDESAKQLIVQAEQGDPDARHAQYMLGNMYVDGQGVPSDQALAEEWMRRAAASGHEEAQEWLRKREAAAQ